MCKMKNENAAELLKNYRQLDSEGISSLSDEELARVYALGYAFKKEIENYEASLKERLIANKIEKQVYSDLDYKLERAEGRASKVFDVAKIGAAFVKAKRLPDFYKCVNFVYTRSQDILSANDPIQKSIAVNSSIEYGSESISVRKLSKKDVADLLKK